MRQTFQVIAIVFAVAATVFVTSFVPYFIGKSNGSLQGWRAAYMDGFETARKRYYVPEEVDSIVTMWPSEVENCFNGTDLPTGGEVWLQGENRVIAKFKVKGK
jgi:hypothetical protein